MNKKKIYTAPAIQVLNVETEAILASSLQYNVDNIYGGGIKNKDLDDDWEDESNWGKND